MTPALRKKLLLYAGYAAFFFVCFLVFAYWTFPYDRLRDFIVQEVERPAGPDGRRRPSGVQLSIGELSPSWVTGVDLEDVTIVKEPEEPDGRALRIVVEEASARVGLFALLGGETDVSFDATVGGGTIEGAYAAGEESTSLLAELEQVQLRQLGIMSSLVGLPVGGVIDGSIDLTIADDTAQTQGDVALTIDNLQIGGGQVPIPGMTGGLTVERIDAGKLELDMDVENGVARIQKLQADGQDLDIQGSGSVRLLRELQMSRLDLMLRVAFAEEYKTKSEHTRRLFTLLDSPLAPAELRSARTPDGALQWRLNGSFGSRIGTSPAGRARIGAAD